MNDKELGQALLEYSRQPDIRQLTWRILDRDQRQVRRLARVTVFLWVVAFAAILFVLYLFGLLMPRQAEMRLQFEKALAQAEMARRNARQPKEVQPTKTKAHQPAGVASPIDKLAVEHRLKALQYEFQGASLAIILSVTLLAFASLGTVMLVFASRRATLRQVNAGLMEISEQLKQLRAADGE